MIREICDHCGNLVVDDGANVDAQVIDGKHGPLTLKVTLTGGPASVMCGACLVAALTGAKAGLAKRYAPKTRMVRKRTPAKKRTTESARQIMADYTEEFGGTVSWVDGDVIGRKYNSDAIILDVTWADDDTLLVLLVEEDEDHPDEPFVVTRISLDALDIRHDIERTDTFRYAFIMWEHHS